MRRRGAGGRGVGDGRGEVFAANGRKVADPRRERGAVLGLGIEKPPHGGVIPGVWYLIRPDASPPQEEAPSEPWAMVMPPHDHAPIMARTPHPRPLMPVQVALRYAGLFI